jgi:hypothetical protein
MTTPALTFVLELADVQPPITAALELHAIACHLCAFVLQTQGQRRLSG